MPDPGTRKIKPAKNRSTSFALPGAVIIEGHVQGLSNTRSLGEAGVPVYVVDKVDCIARHSRHCLGFFRCPPFDSDALADFLIQLAKDQRIDGWLLLPSNDHAVLTLSRNKSRLEAHFKVITPGLDIIEHIYDKSRLLTLAQTLGVPIPDTFYAQDASPADVPPAFPVLTRAVRTGFLQGHGPQGVSGPRQSGTAPTAGLDRQNLSRGKNPDPVPDPG